MPILAGAGIGDPEGTRTVLAIVALLVVMGVALVMVAVWLYRSTRPDPGFLAPLELMDDPAWRRADPMWQRRRLDEVRPGTAAPRRRTAAPPDLDAAFDAGPVAAGFDDLHDDGVVVYGDPLLASSGGRNQPDEDDPPGGVFGGPETSIGRGGPLVGNETPMAARRPMIDDLDDDDFDPDLVAQAAADLEAELGSGEGWLRRRHTDR